VSNERRKKVPKTGKSQGEDLAPLGRARALWARNLIPASLRLFDQTVRLHPNHPIALADAGRALGSVYMYSRAEMLLGRLEQIGNRRADLQHLAGQSYRLIRRADAAQRCFERSVTLNGTPRDCYLELALLAERANNLADARHWISERLRGQIRDAEGSVAFARILRRQGELARAESLLNDVLKQTNAHWMTRQRAAYELAALHDEQASFPAAWQAMEQAKTIARPHAAPARAHRDRMIAALGRIRQAFGGEHHRRWRDEDPQGSGNATVLLTGLPRSGTTLLEHMLAAHSQIVAADEWDLFPRWIFPALLGYRPLEEATLSLLDATPAPQLARKRHMYLQGMAAATERTLSGNVLLDKNPSLLALVPAYLRLLPHSRVIVMRRDPRDVLVSCLFTPMGLNDFGVDFLSVEEGAARIVWELRFWRGLSDELGDCVVELDYEELVKDWRASLRDVLPSLGLAWEPTIAQYDQSGRGGYLNAPSYVAVQQPVTTRSVGRWRNYSQQLAPVMDRYANFV
jgi:tetratricopeptide (TPR) repeat protein